MMMMILQVVFVFWSHACSNFRILERDFHQIVQDVTQLRQWGEEDTDNTDRPNAEEYRNEAQTATSKCVGRITSAKATTNEWDFGQDQHDRETTHCVVALEIRWDLHRRSASSPFVYRDWRLKSDCNCRTFIVTCLSVRDKSQTKSLDLLREVSRTWSEKCNWTVRDSRKSCTKSKSRWLFYIKENSQRNSDILMDVVIWFASLSELENDTGKVVVSVSPRTASSARHDRTRNVRPRSNRRWTSVYHWIHS